MSNASLELGGGNWAAKVKEDGTGNLLGYAVGDTSGKYLPREFTFSRGADIGATRVNKDGLVEKFRENQFTYSNDFRSSLHWGHAGLAAYYGPESNPSGVPDDEQGYDGSGDVSFLLSTTNTLENPTSVHQFNTTTPNIAAVQTFSIYAKALGYKWLVIRTNTGTMDTYFDLENGEVGTEGSAVIEAKMVPAGNGWYRCSVTVNNSATVTSVAFGISNGDNSYNFAASRDEGGTNRGGIYVMHAQWDRGLVAAEYLESGSTTGKAGVLDNLPRIDYTSGSAQLLMEPSRTNELPHSEYFTRQTYWQLNSAGTRTDNVAVSPEGVKNAMSLKSVGSEYNILRSAPVSLDTSTEYVFSFYAKNVDATNAHYRVYNTDASGDVVGSTSYISQLSTTEWKRIEVSFTTNATDTNYSVYFASGNLGGEILLWGAQLEKGSYATSYIPTHGASDTRTSEGIPTAGAGVVDMSSFFQGDDFTLVAHFAENPVLSRDSSQGGIRLSDGDNQVGGFRIYRNSASAKLHVLFDPTSGDDFGYIIDGTKVAINRSGDDFKIFVDGSQTQSFTNVNFDSGLDDLKIWGDGSTIKITKLKLFDEALSDGDMVTETS